MVYGVSLVLTLSAFVSACGDVPAARRRRPRELHPVRPRELVRVRRAESARRAGEPRATTTGRRRRALRARRGRRAGLAATRTTTQGARARRAVAARWPAAAANPTMTRRLDVGVLDLLPRHHPHRAEAAGQRATEASIADMRATERGCSTIRITRGLLPHAWRGAGATATPAAPLGGRLLCDPATARRRGRRRGRHRAPAVGGGRPMLDRWFRSITRRRTCRSRCSTLPRARGVPRVDHGPPVRGAVGASTARVRVPR